jgi:hypothetical protein
MLTYLRYALKSRKTMYLGAIAALLLAASVIAAGYVANKVVRLSPIELDRQTVSQEFDASKQGITASLVFKVETPGTYEVGLEFPERKLERGKAFEGRIRIDLFEKKKPVGSREVSDRRMRAYYADADSYRIIVLADVELPVGRGVKEEKLVATVVKEDTAFSDYTGVKLFVRPSPVK